jgi:SAM-dependent methyltransferase
MEQLSNCPLCGEDVNPDKPFVTCNDFLVSGQEFNITRCSNCSLLFTNPRPEYSQMQYYYQSTDYISHTEQKKDLIGKVYHMVQKEMLRRKRKLIENILPGPKRILDYGCGSGGFLKYMQDTENEVYGFEPGEFPRKMAQSKGLQVMAEHDELKKLGKFNVITLWHVLEHLPDFKTKLREFNEMLLPEGVLILAVPLWESFDASFYGKHWAGYDLPRHLFHFSLHNLEVACKDADFSLMQTNALPFDAYYISLLSEKQKKNPLGALRAIAVGTISGLKAMSGKRPWSSQIFVFGKSWNKI